MTHVIGHEALSDHQCLRLLSEVSIGRVVFTVDALPAVQPVYFAADPDHRPGTVSIVICTRDDAPVASIAGDSVVAFEIDNIDTDRERGWHVTAVGHAEIVDNPDQREQLARLPLRVWGPGDRTVYIRIDLEMLQGTRVGSS